MKRRYLEELEELLNRYQVEDIEKSDIVDEYSDMYDGWIDSGMSEEEVEDKLGDPSSIINELMEGYEFKQFYVEKNHDNKIVALMPFVALIIFFIAGFGYNLWQYAWMAFLLIPMVAIVQSMLKQKNPNTFIGLVPFFCLISYLLLGFIYDLWHPAWIIWLIIPVSGILIGNRKSSMLVNLTALAPFIAMIGYFVLGEMGYYHPSWLIFFIIPIIGVLNDKNIGRILLYELCLIGGVVGYLYLYMENYAWDISLIAFIPLALIGLYYIFKELSDVPLGYKVCIIGSVGVYLFLGFEYSLWGYAWLLFLSIPVYAIVVEVKDDDKYMALMPFIALTTFFTLGWFFDLWAFSWMAFLIIPIYAIIKEA
jgi:uncharacterized membrane protein